MTQEEKAMVMGFIDTCYHTKVIEDEVSKSIDTLWKLINEVGKMVKNSKKEKSLCIELESQFLETIALVKWRYFEYGEVAQDLSENYNMNWTPYKKEA
ncbi:hypothetical protein [Fusobacterium varium]|mgnify:CR=1 FL=1|jgi:hypothetical protein|nr:MAG TPA: hypothetical protein [Caudoviricetes sp.]